MAKICLACTATALVPSSISLLFRPKARQFLYALVNSSLAFFLFSFQVHEKSILIAALPIALIFPMEPFMSIWFLQVSTFSMLPLLVKDGLTLAFVSLSGAFFLLPKIIIDNVKNEKLKSKNFLQILWNINKKKEGKFMENFMIISYVISTIVQIGLFVCYFYVTPPTKLPFLHPLLISAFSCCHFVFFLLYFNVKQIFYE
jgi:alpha-1,3-glucosyltransferase